jgi:hypothetical protein
LTAIKRVLADDRSKAIQLVVLACVRKRMFEVDMEHCPNCGGELKIIAAILEQSVIEKILTYLGLQADCGRGSAPARGPAPQEGFALASASAVCKTKHRLSYRERAARRAPGRAGRQAGPESVGPRHPGAGSQRG